MLIYERDVYNVLPTNHKVSITQKDDIWNLEGTYYGVPLDTIESREIKAVTYSDMEVKKTPNGWRLYVVFDV
jgi:SHS2 domain-containing protein